MSLSVMKQSNPGFISASQCSWPGSCRTASTSYSSPSTCQTCKILRISVWPKLKPTYFQSSYCIRHPWCCENRFSILLQWLHPSRYLCALPLPILQVTLEDTKQRKLCVPLSNLGGSVQCLTTCLKDFFMTRNENGRLKCKICTEHSNQIR